MDLDIHKNDQPNQVKTTSEERWVMRRNPKGFAKGKETVEELFWQDIKAFAPKIIQKVDNSGAPTQAELARALENHTFHGDESPVAAAIYGVFSDIHKNNGFNFGEPRLTRNDIDIMVQKSLEVEKKYKVLRDLDNWAKTPDGARCFSRLGGEVRLNNIDRALQQPNLNPTERAKLSEIKANFNSITVQGVIKIGDISSCFKQLQTTPKYDVMNYFHAIMGRVETNQNNPNMHRLYADSNPLNSIKPGAVVQRSSADCSFKASLAGYAALRPEELSKRVSSNNGTFVVELPGVKQSKFKVQPPTDEELGLYNGRDTNDGFWPIVFAKAYGQYEYNKVANPFNRDRLDKLTIDEMAGENKTPAVSISALTGHNVETCKLKDLDDSALKQKIESAMAEKRIVVLGTPENDMHVTVDGYRPAHALTILGAKNNSGKIEITIRDPHGEGSNNPNGVSQADIAKVRRNFAMIYIETNVNAFGK